MVEFLAWKEKEEEISNTSYVKTQQTYHSKFEGSYCNTIIDLVVLFIEDGSYCMVSYLDNYSSHSYCMYHDVTHHI